MRELKFKAWNTVLGGWQKSTLDLKVTPDGLYTVESGNIFIIVQYTGEKDRGGKGKEIYHKDIFPLGGIVEWRAGCWYVSFPAYDILLYDYLRNDPTREVIGNCFENPELDGEVKYDEMVNTNREIPCTICGEDDHRAIDHEIEDKNDG